MRIKIISDGTIMGTRVLNADTGDALEGVKGVTIHPMFVDGDMAVMATVTFIQPELDIIAKDPHG